MGRPASSSVFRSPLPVLGLLLLAAAAHGMSTKKGDDLMVEHQDAYFCEISLLKNLKLLLVTIIGQDQQERRGPHDGNLHCSCLCRKAIIIHRITLRTKLPWRRKGKIWWYGVNNQHSVIRMNSISSFAFYMQDKTSKKGEDLMAVIYSQHSFFFVQNIADHNFNTTSGQNHKEGRRRNGETCNAILMPTGNKIPNTSFCLCRLRRLWKEWTWWYGSG